ncbi:glycosyltransferase family 4 protein [Alkalihalobacillus sp. CinArs1]|uniref:glycosyltransferase family 4 protein n=1 Tax=Alkalihalobacillus sp. CinArs1 TaxID=2995314 RepID=UPI0022DE2C33|nr:glycosyltransferase family 4 protein [Alkalihalobacillus sp. CinArs1]
MKLLIIGRGYPEVETGMIGIFEYEQAKAVSNFSDSPLQILFTFSDNRSVFRLRKLNNIKKYDSNIYIRGSHFPIGGLPKILFDKLKTISSLYNIKKIINEHGIPDIIHIHFPIITLTEEIWDYLASLDTNIVITEHYSRVQNKELSIKQINLLRKVTANADKFLSVNNLLPTSIKELTGVDREYIVVPNVVASSFSYCEDLNNDIYRFVSIGRLVKGKKFDIVIEAFAKRFNNVKNVELIIVGDGEEYSNLKEQINSLNMSDKIKLTGFLNREKTAKLLSKSNSYVTASSFETFGVPVVEAMSCGKPVIVANVSPLAQYINNDRGLFFQVDCVESLGDKMNEIHKNRSMYNSKEIADFAHEQFSEEAIGEQLFEIYQSCLSKNS